MFFAITAASLPVLNAAVPKGWRRRSHTLKGLRTLSVLENGNTDNAMTEVQFGRDGMVMEGSKEGPKDSFHKKTEKRWDIYTKGIKQPETIWHAERPGPSEDVSSESAESSKGGSWTTRQNSEKAWEDAGDYGKESKDQKQSSSTLNE